MKDFTIVINVTFLAVFKNSYNEKFHKKITPFTLSKVITIISIILTKKKELKTLTYYAIFS